ncbi:MAG: LamB/YcsF family protein [Chloroflexi bacterium]|nr:LamB/YcsF family protein [Chloroflexota bacterium]
MKIDLNCDLGEAFGRYTLGDDASIMPLITSANIACGFHAGDASVMQVTVRLAKQHGVAIGAHPGWPDLQGFGRREMALSPEETESLVLYQIGALAAFAKAEGMELYHVKPHGALYNQSARDEKLAEAVARAVKRFSVELALVGLAGSRSIDAARGLGLRVLQEGFPDRGYTSEGMLMPRSQPGAILSSVEEVAAHAVSLAVNGIEFEKKQIRVDTLCLHGDNVHAVDNARKVRDALQKAGIEVAF